MNPGSPILIDVGGNGFDLTSAAGGVLFDILATGIKRQVSWTAAGTDDAWLVLDRNGNGVVDSGTELFGNKTPQPSGPRPHGFLALAEYDKAGFGGNGDGVITSADSIWHSLRLWRDANHNGLSEPGELVTLSAVGIEGLDLQYHESRRRDENGNLFKYRARVYTSRSSTVGRWAFDVFLVHAAR